MSSTEQTVDIASLEVGEPSVELTASRERGENGDTREKSGPLCACRSTEEAPLA